MKLFFLKYCSDVDFFVLLPICVTRQSVIVFNYNSRRTELLFIFSFSFIFVLLCRDFSVWAACWHQRISVYIYNKRNKIPPKVITKCFLVALTLKGLK